MVDVVYFFTQAHAPSPGKKKNNLQTYEKKHKKTSLKITKKHFAFLMFDLVLLNWCGVDVVQAWWAEWPPLLPNFLVIPCEDPENPKDPKVPEDPKDPEHPKVREDPKYPKRP